MDSLRKSPVARAISWVLTAAMVFPLLMLGQKTANAQTQQAITVIVADFTDLRTKNTSPLAIQARDAVFNELQATGQGRFNPIPEKEVRNEAKLIGIRVPSSPSQPANFTKPDLVRLAKALHADGIVRGEVNTAVNKKGVPSTVAIQARVEDAATGDAINGSTQILNIKQRPGEAVEEAVTRTVADTGLSVVRQMVARQTVTGTVLNVNVDNIIINRGTRDGLKVGDELLILQYQPDGSFISKGKIKIARAYATDSECDAVSNLGISPENIARGLYRPEFEINLQNLGNSTATSSKVNFSSIGRTLSVIGLGVLIAVAVKGGQTSVTNVTAEPTSESNSPVVWVRFGDNIFGQAGVLQYKIYRDPDFPFTSPGSGSQNGNGNGGGGGNTGTTTVSLPVGTAASTLRIFIDRASPNYPFLTGNYLTATSNGGNNTGGTTSSGGGNNGGGGGNNNSNGGCGSATSTVDTGFTPGRSYTYSVTAMILRQTVTTGDSNGGQGTGGLGGGGAGGSIGTGGGSGTGGTGTGNGGNGNGNNNGGGAQCIETDPVRSGLATPITPVLITSPTNGAANIDVTQFSPSFGSRAGADLFQIEVSTDRTFSNKSAIYTQQILSTSPTQDNVAQTLATPINLSTSSALLQNKTFAAFVGASGTTTGVLPTLYFRVGARHDEDIPGPVNAISQNSSDKDHTFRFVYSQIISFTPVPIPPANPGKATAKTDPKATNVRGFRPLQTQTTIRTVSKRTLSIRTTGTTRSAIDVLTGRDRTRH